MSPREDDVVTHFACSEFEDLFTYICIVSEVIFGLSYVRMSLQIVDIWKTYNHELSSTV